MSKCDFAKIYVIGYGRVTGEVIEKLSELKGKYDYNLEYIEYEVHEFNQALKFCVEHDISYMTEPNKQKLTELFMAIEDTALIISASNNYLFPEKLLAKDNIKVINFHNALLPKFPGRNAPSWVIYEGEKETGITWHYVNKDVDAGNIIVQKSSEIGEDTKAYELADTLMKLATEGFCECIEDVLNNKAQTKTQEVVESRRIYKSKEVPGNATFDMMDDAEDIYRLLRTIDYGKNDIFPQAQTIIDERKVRILRYKRIPAEKITAKENVRFLEFKNGDLLQLKYAEI